MNLQPRLFAHRNFRAPAQDTIAARSRSPRSWLVGVISDRSSLRKAIGLRNRPDLYEIRLDAFCDRLEEIEKSIPQFRAPLIFTARHPAEGGHHFLTTSRRRDLLQHFLEHAAWIDLEVRSLKRMKTVAESARAKKIGLIFSFHDFRSTPSPATLRRMLAQAIEAGADIFKIATRIDKKPQLHRLISFVAENGATFPIAAMGIGVLGAESRRALPSCLQYAALGRPNVPGQQSLARLQRARKAYTI